MFIEFEHVGIWWKRTKAYSTITKFCCCGRSEYNVVLVG